MLADIIAEKGFQQYSELPGMESPQQGRADVGIYHSREGFPATQLSTRYGKSSARTRRCGYIS